MFRLGFIFGDAFYYLNSVRVWGVDSFRFIHLFNFKSLLRF